MCNLLTEYDTFITKQSSTGTNIIHTTINPYNVCQIYHWVNHFGKGFNALAPGKYGNNLKTLTSIILKLIMQNNSLDTHCEIACSWMPKNLINGKSTLVQVMTRCLQATIRYLNQRRPRSISPYMASLGHNDIKYTRPPMAIRFVSRPKFASDLWFCC